MSNLFDDKLEILKRQFYSTGSLSENGFMFLIECAKGFGDLWTTLENVHEEFRIEEENIGYRADKKRIIQQLDEAKTDERWKKLMLF